MKASSILVPHLRMDWSNCILSERKKLNFARAARFVPRKHTEFEKLTLELINRILDKRPPSERRKRGIYDNLMRLIHEKRGEIGDENLERLAQNIRDVQQQKPADRSLGPDVIANYIQIYTKRRKRWITSISASRDIITVWTMLVFYHENYEYFYSNPGAKNQKALRASIRRELFRYMKGSFGRHIRGWGDITTIHEMTGPGNGDPNALPWPLKVLIYATAALQFLVMISRK